MFPRSWFSGSWFAPRWFPQSQGVSPILVTQYLILTRIDGLSLVIEVGG